jgi:hypothetical protein
MEETLTPGVDGAEEEEEEEAGKPKPLLPPRELLGKIWFLLAFNVGASHVGWSRSHSPTSSPPPRAAAAPHARRWFVHIRPTDATPGTLPPRRH